MRPQHLLRLGVAQALGEGGGALHVREQDGDKAARCLRLSSRLFAAALIQELSQRFQVRGVTEQWEVHIAL